MDLLERQNLAALPEVMRPPIAIDVVQLLALERAWSSASEYLQFVRETLDVVTWQALSAWVLRGDNHPQDADGRASEALRNLAPFTHLSTREFLARVLMQKECVSLHHGYCPVECPALFVPVEKR